VDYHREVSKETEAAAFRRYEAVVNQGLPCWDPLPPYACEEHLTCRCACGHEFWTRAKDFVEDTGEISPFHHFDADKIRDVLWECVVEYSVEENEDDTQS
jgi:hypothetical protein